MKSRFFLGWILAVLSGIAGAQAQQPQPVGPDQPVSPQIPTLQPRTQAQPIQPPAADQDVAAPFQLSAQEQAQLDTLLQAWEQSSARIKTFKCRFTRFEYSTAFGPIDPNKPTSVDRGELRYAAPDRGLFAIEGPANPAANTSSNPERWICDGKSVFQYDYAQKRVVEYPLSPEMQGKAIADSPLPFLFGSSAVKLKQRYYLRLITPAAVQAQEVWLESWPRFQSDRANMTAARLILKVKNLEPYALAIYAPDKSRQNYVFENISINDPLARLLEGDPFVPRIPKDWVKVVENPPQSQTHVSQEQAGAARR